MTCTTNHIAAFCLVFLCFLFRGGGVERRSPAACAQGKATLAVRELPRGALGDSHWSGKNHRHLESSYKLSCSRDVGPRSIQKDEKPCRLLLPKGRPGAPPRSPKPRSGALPGWVLIISLRPSRCVSSMVKPHKAFDSSGGKRGASQSMYRREIRSHGEGNHGLLGDQHEGMAPINNPRIPLRESDNPGPFPPFPSRSRMELKPVGICRLRHLALSPCDMELSIRSGLPWSRNGFSRGVPGCIPCGWKIRLKRTTLPDRSFGVER